MRIVWKKPIALALWSVGAAFIGSAGIALFTSHEKFADVLNMIGCVFVIIHGIYRMKFDPAYRDRSPFDRNKLLRLF